MRWYIALVGLLHAVFMVCEMVPWSEPILLKSLSKKNLKESEGFNPDQQKLVSEIVHNAGIYNAVLAGGLFWAAYRGQRDANVALVLCLGAAVAGAFGAMTLQSPVPGVQCAMGLIGAVWVARSLVVKPL